MKEHNFCIHLQYNLYLQLLLVVLFESKNAAWKLHWCSRFQITRRKLHNAKMRIAHKIFTGNFCMDTITWNNRSFFLLSVSVKILLLMYGFLYSLTNFLMLNRCRFFAQSYFWIPIVHGAVTFFVIANFTLATFMDPGVIPKGK